MKRSFYYALGLHILVIGLFLLKIPFSKSLPTHEHTVVVDVVKVGPETNLKNSNKPALIKKPLIKRVEPPKQISPKKETKNKKAAKIAQKIPDKKKDLKPKKQDKKKIDKAQNELDNLLKDLDSPQGDGKTKNKNSSSKLYNDSAPLSISETDNIKIQIERKFTNPIALNFKPGEIVIHIKMIMNEDGSVKNVEVLNSSSYSAKYHNVFTTLKNSMVRAVYAASPIENMPKEKYHGSSGWSEIELSFDAFFLMNQ